MNSCNRKWCLLSLAISMFQSGTFAQNIQNDVVVYIPGTISVFTAGNITNTGFIQNNGSIHLNGDWINKSVYQGTGNIYLEGSNQQLSNNNQAIDKLFVGGGGIKFVDGKIIIQTKITLDNGILRVADSDSVFLSQECTATGGSPSSYVDGQLIASGSGYKFFPIGKNGGYYPVELTAITGIDPITGMEAEENLQGFRSETKVRPLTNVYWTRSTVSGSYENSPITLGYAVPDSIRSTRIVIAQAEKAGDLFSIQDNVTFSDEGDYDVIGSRAPESGSVFVLGVIPVDAPQKYYFSTTLSPHATNPENRAVRLMGDFTTTGEFYFQVFNRWGLLIYETPSAEFMATTGWEGKQNGNSLPSGAYPYSLKYTDSTGKAVKQNGFITIIN